MNQRRTLLRSAAATALLAASPLRAQQPGRSWRIGSVYVATSATTKPFEESFLAGLADLGFVAGRNLVYEVRNCDGDAARLPAAIDELLALKPDLLVGIEQVARVMKSKTTAIPIVLTVSSDPVAAGLVKSLRQPGGNVTGNASLDGPMLVKQVELFAELLPRMTKMAMLTDPGVPAADSVDAEVRAAAKTKHISLLTYRVPDRAALDRAFAEMERQRPDALLGGMQSGLIFSNLPQIFAEAARLRIPVSASAAAANTAPALFSYGVNLLHEFRRAAGAAARILKGANSGDLPIEQPTRFELVLNLKTAKALGIKIPQSALIRAERVIE